MMHLGRRSNAARLVVGGALAAALAGASSAWACTPVARTIVVAASIQPDPTGQRPTVGQVAGDSYTHGVVDGRATDDLSDSGVAPVPVEIRVGATAEEAAADGALVVARATGPAYTATIALGGPGYYYFYAFARNEAGELVRPSLLTFKVEPVAAAPNPGNGAGTNTGTGGTGGSANGNGPTTPVGGTLNPSQVNPGPVTATAPILPAKPSTPAPATRAPAAAPRTPAPAPRTLPAQPAAATATASPAPAPAATTPEPTPATAERTFPLPPQGNLWSATDSSGRVPSLLDAPSTPPSKSGFPMGAGLLGVGVLALAGVAVVTGKRRLALARRVRS